jgi:hypothetical protein
VSQALEFLERVGLVVRGKGRYAVGQARVHLPSDSRAIGKHHTNWRLHALRSLERYVEREELHYSSIFAVTDEDVLKLKAMILKFVEETRSVIRPSREETLRCLGIDFFRV